MRTSTILHMISGMIVGFVFLGISFISPHKESIIGFAPLMGIFWAMGMIMYSKYQTSEVKPQ